MTLDRYRRQPTPFERFYYQFASNVFVKRKYRITLADGTTAEGIPSAPSVINPFDPSAAFSFDVGGEMYRIPFADLTDAAPV